MRGRVAVMAGAAVAALAVAGALPEPAAAHGLVGRADLPIPAWLFGWAAAAVLVISFVALALLWPRPRLESAPRRRLVPLGPWADVVLGALGIGAFGLTVWAGLSGTQVPTANLAPTVVYVLFWIGVPFASLLFGDVFRLLSPWRALARAFAWAAGRLAPGGLPAPLPYPRRLGRWPAAAGLLAFAWVELVYTGKADPGTVAALALAYAAIQLVAMSVWGIEPWSREGDPFGVYFGLFARVSVFERRDGWLLARPPLSGLPGLDVTPGTLAMLVVMIGSTTFDGLSQGPLWTDVAPDLQRYARDGLGAGFNAANEVAYTLGLVVCIALVAAIYAIGVAGMRTVADDVPHRHLALRFAHTLVPIALAYVIAHYFSLLAYQGQAVAFLISDPRGDGSNWLGTADASIDYGVVGATGVWYVQVAALVLGHVAALTLAHDRALSVFRSATAATRSQYWMLIVMIGFTSLGLWLLSAANL
ncbi:MAG: fenitrothion hydrolase [Solirubrobacteraceae bacterium]